MLRVLTTSQFLRKVIEYAHSYAALSAIEKMHKAVNNSNQTNRVFFCSADAVGRML